MFVRTQTRYFQKGMPVNVLKLAVEPGKGGKRVQGQNAQTVSHKIIKIFRDATKILLRLLGQVLGTPRRAPPRAPRRLLFAATGVAATRKVALPEDCERNGVSQHLRCCLHYYYYSKKASAKFPTEIAPLTHR